MNTTQQLGLIGGGIAIIIIVGVLVMIARFYRMVEQGKALIVNSTTGQKVTFTGSTVLPIINKAEIMDISVKTIEIDRRGKEGLICKDNIRADIKVTFFVRVNKTVEDVLKVAQAIGCIRASDQVTLETLFAAKFSEALKSVGKGLEFEDLYTKREKFRDDILQVIGKDLNGYVLDDAAIDYLEQTPLDLLDPENILDADGIRKITAITTQRNVETNDLKQRERMDIGKQNLASDEAVFRYDQARADAEAKKNKEIAIAQARESEEAKRIQIEEGLKTKKAQEKAAEEAQVAEQNRQRAVMVAEQARLRELAVEEVRVTKARELEDISRQKETQVRDIEREEELQVKKRKIADVIRERVAVEKTVAQEEEATKDLRTIAGAKRDKDARVIGAEAEAQSGLVVNIKKAEADEEVAKYRARQRLITADAELEAAERDARAKIRIAEGVQAEQAAPGLAEVRVKEADAVAVEKQGLAQVRVRESQVVVREREGLVEAEIVKQREIAEATGMQQKLLAEVAAKEAEAGAIQKRMEAEAEGLRRKGEAMKALEGAGRAHEEFRLRLQTSKDIALEELETRVEVASKQAEILCKAFERANIHIVGGDGTFFDRFVRAVSVGSSIDGAIESSKTLQTVLADHLSGNGDLLSDLKGVLSAEGVRDLTVSAVLGKLQTRAPEGERDKIQKLIEHAQKLGIDKIAP